jgi:hypothetical protein
VAELHVAVLLHVDPVVPVGFADTALLLVVVVVVVVASFEGYLWVVLLLGWDDAGSCFLAGIAPDGTLMC